MAKKKNFINDNPAYQFLTHKKEEKQEVKNNKEEVKEVIKEKEEVTEVKESEKEQEEINNKDIEKEQYYKRVYVSLTEKNYNFIDKLDKLNIISKSKYINKLIDENIQIEEYLNKIAKALEKLKEVNKDE